ncbi:hypothetical protein ABZ345_22790 [Lentzea sp. NPDC005914]|uniref:hypothetical protein n=1 Tax=Lentzea sp. NPDC005914 TaxID=3154572 RepID=UPI0033D6E06B
MRTEEGIDLFSKPVDLAPLETDGKPPRGLTEEGWVRTTGWLQVGDHPVSSALVAALTGLLWASVGAAVLVREFPVTAGVLVLATPVVTGVGWWLFTSRIRPASVARNVAAKPAESLVPGDLVRLYGSIGPVGQVAEVALGEDVDVTFQGGLRQSWPADSVVRVAELLN